MEPVSERNSKRVFAPISLLSSLSLCVSYYHDATINVGRKEDAGGQDMYARTGDFKKTAAQANQLFGIDVSEHAVR